MAKEAIVVGGSSHLNMGIVIHFVKELILVHKMNNDIKYALGHKGPLFLFY